MGFTLIFINMTFSFKRPPKPKRKKFVVYENRIGNRYFDNMEEAKEYIADTMKDNFELYIQDENGEEMEREFTKIEKVKVLYK